MSIQITDSHNVALYDSVTGRAFGVVFQDEDEATAFREYATDKGIALSALNYAGFEAAYRDFRAVYQEVQEAARPEPAFLKHLPADAQAEMREFLKP